MKGEEGGCGGGRGENEEGFNERVGEAEGRR